MDQEQVSHQKSRGLPFPVFYVFQVSVVQLSFPTLIVVGMYLPPGITVSSFNYFVIYLLDLLMKFLTNYLAANYCGR